MDNTKLMGNPVSPASLRALLLEDDPHDLKLMVALLQDSGYKVQFDVTDSPQTFRQRLEATDYDLILADFNMRDWTALDALDILKSLQKDVPLIVLTGSLGEEAAVECIKHGACDFVLKDRPARLPAAVQQALEQSHLRAEKRIAEDAFREERHLFLTLMDNLPDVVYFKDWEGRFLQINAAMARQFGLAHPLEAIGKTDFDFFLPEHAKSAQEDELEIIRTGKPIVSKEEKETWPDGRVTWVLTTKMPFRDAGGKIVGTFGVSHDITQRKQSAESLRESEERFRATFEDAGIGMALVDMNGRAFKTNSAFRKMLGYSEEELCALLFTEYTHPEDRDLDWNLYAELTAGERERYEIEKRLIRKSGEIVTGLLTVSLVKDRNGHPLCAIRMTQDVTERKHAEAALRESEERYRSLFERNLAGVFVTTWDGRILDCNQAMADIMGFASPKEALNLRVSDLYVNPEDRGIFLANLAAEGRLANYEMHLRRQDGRIVWLIGNISRLPKTSTGLRIIEGTLIDVTERKLAESETRRLAQIVNSSDDAIFSTTPEGLIATWNAGAERMFGHSAAEIAGNHFTILIPKERHAGLADSAIRLLRGEVIHQHESDHIRKDGSIFPVMLTLSPVRDEKGLVKGVSGIARDITERKRATEALRQSEEKYRSIISNVPDVVWTLDANLQFTFISRNIERISGFPVDEIARRGPDLFLASLHPDDVPRVKEGLRALFAEGRPYDVEVRARRKDGEWIWVHDRAVATYEKNGLRYADGLLSDITERKWAEEEIHFKTALLEAQSETTIDGILVVDESDRILLTNKQFGKMWNLPEDVVAESDDRKMIQSVVPQIKDPDGFLAKVLYLNTHPLEESRDELELKDGRVFDRYSSPLRGRTGKFYGRIWYFRDITERRKAEAERVRLVTAIEQSAEGVVITDLKGSIEYVNPAFTVITGYTREEALGQNPRILKSAEQDPAFYQVLWQTILAGKAWHGELINRRKDGTIYHEQMNIAPVKNVAGEVTHFIATKEDITERRTLEAQLQQAAKMEAVGRLAGGVAHDFNNLLTVINGYSEILLEMVGSNATAIEYLHEIHHAGTHAASLTRQLLAFSRRQVLAPQILDLNLSVANLEKMLRRLIGEDVRLRTELSNGLGKVKADPGQIDQVIINLAVNARDAMEKGGDLIIETANVELDENYTRQHPSASPGPHVMLAVSDTGKGMSPETRARIFEPFFTTKELGKGTGLGLATVYGIVKQTGGNIWVYSELGKGTVFKVYFPIAAENPDEAEPVAASKHSSFGTETILLVEDEEGVASLVRVALAVGGYTVLEARNAESALAICTQHPGKIQLLLSDVVMPGMSGPGVADKVLALRPGIKVLFMSGYTDDSIVHHGVKNHETPFIQKPFTPEGLRRKIRDVLGTKSG